jgi:DNA-binding transcriptional ArsR family regulator
MLDQSAPLDLLYHALADPTRRGMVERLSRSPASISELAQPLDMTLSAREIQMSDVNHFGIGRARLGRHTVLGGAVSAAAVAGLPASRVAANTSL